MLSSLVRGKVDLLFISESKIDASFPTAQFMIPGFTLPFRKDRNDKGGGVLLYLRNDIPVKFLNKKCPKLETQYENIFIEITLHNKKWLICGSYNPKKSKI